MKEKNKVINMFGNSKIVQNEGVKYSELLGDFMTPFQNDFLGFEFIEDIFEFAINAWNFGNMKTITASDDFEDIISTALDEDIDFALLKKMIDYKVKNFKKYTNFIATYELKGTDEEPILSVITEGGKQYFANLAKEVNEQTTIEEFEENYINRTAIVIKPLQPFFDWVNNLYPDYEMNDVCESSTYLVSDEKNSVENYLKKKFDKLFKMELEEWHTNKKEWPQKRNYKMFKQWFSIEISITVFDLEKRPVLKSE